MDDLSLLKNRFFELAARSDEKGIWIYSDFLTQAEQSELKKMRLPVNFELIGGYDGAERRIAVFGNENDIYYSADIPLKIVKISPVLQKFADALTHRDFLGSVTALGIKREKIGDIIVRDNTAYLIGLDNIADYIASELKEVKHTTVKCETVEKLPKNALPELKCEERTVSSERIDVLIAAVYNLSRNRAQILIDAEKVFCGGVLVKSASFLPNDGSIISVRGFGRFIFDGVLRKTKKGKDVIAVKIY